MRTVGKWGTEGGWQARVQMRDAQNMKGIQRKTDKQVMANLVKYSDIVGKAIEKFKKDLKAGKIRFVASDLEKLIRLACLLDGHPLEDDRKPTIECDFLKMTDKEIKIEFERVMIDLKDRVDDRVIESSKT